MPTLGPVYLIHGDDHGAVAERRASLRALAESQMQAASVEYLEGDTATPMAVAQALATMTFAIGQRVIIVDGVESWKQAEIEKHLIGALDAMPPDTTLALFAREEGRNKVPAVLHSAVKRAGGNVAAHSTVKPWELPKWVRAQAANMGITLDPEAAKALVAQVGERQQRLLRELEKLALERAEDQPEIALTAEDIAMRAANSPQSRLYSLTDALIAGDATAATQRYLRLRQQGERLTGCLYVIGQCLRDALAVAERLDAGESAGEIKRGLRMSPRNAERLIEDVRRSSPERLRAALQTLADVELDTRGGPILTSTHSAGGALDEDTLALYALPALCA